MNNFTSCDGQTQEHLPFFIPMSCCGKDQLITVMIIITLTRKIVQFILVEFAKIMESFHDTAINQNNVPIQAIL